MHKNFTSGKLHFLPFKPAVQNYPVPKLTNKSKFAKKSIKDNEENWTEWGSVVWTKREFCLKHLHNKILHGLNIQYYISIIARNLVTARN